MHTRAATSATVEDAGSGTGRLLVSSAASHTTLSPGTARSCAPGDSSDHRTSHMSSASSAKPARAPSLEAIVDLPAPLGPRQTTARPPFSTALACRVTPPARERTRAAGNSLTDLGEAQRIGARVGDQLGLGARYAAQAGEVWPFRDEKAVFATDAVENLSLLVASLGEPPHRHRSWLARKASAAATDQRVVQVSPPSSSGRRAKNGRNTLSSSGAVDEAVCDQATSPREDRQMRFLPPAAASMRSSAGSIIALSGRRRTRSGMRPRSAWRKRPRSR